MTKEEFIERIEGIKKPIWQKYGTLMALVINDTFNMCEMERIVEERGYKTERQKSPGDGYGYYSDILDDKGEVIGVISNRVHSSTI